ncbi:hypothetical protein AAZX31_01G061400 [Glycine max]
MAYKYSTQIEEVCTTQSSPHPLFYSVVSRTEDLKHLLAFPWPAYSKSHGIQITCSLKKIKMNQEDQARIQNQQGNEEGNFTNQLYRQMIIQCNIKTRKKAKVTIVTA